MAVRYETHIHIDASTAKVWEVLSDIARWPEWAPASPVPTAATPAP